MPLFKKKETPGQTGGEENSGASGARTDLISLIEQYRSQGYSDDQIIAALQQAGYNPDDIYTALNQAGITPAGPASPETFSSGDYPPPPSGAGNFGLGESGLPAPTGSEAGGPGAAASTERIEEIAEAIIDEKWDEFSENFRKVIEWKDKVDSRLERLKTEIENIKANFDKLHESVLGKVGEYDKHISSVGTEVKAMEEVFKKILPGLTENVRELSRITEKTKKKKKK